MLWFYCICRMARYGIHCFVSMESSMIFITNGITEELTPSKSSRELEKNYTPCH
jgi:hypothetical protein